MSNTIIVGGKERPSVDDASMDLAKHFLQDTPHTTEDDHWNLAGAIQQAVEDWFFMREHAASLVATGTTEGLEK